MKLLKGDNIIMLSGKDRGKKAKILAVIPESGKVILEGLNMIKRHTKPRQQGKSGQIVSKERAVSASSVAIICKSCGKATRVGYSIDGDTKIRICKKCKSAV
ncbi:MAG: 50S ribosomal protein L24 [bacterium]|nr:50S ribosomal protein L24 [bacterium]